MEGMHEIECVVQGRVHGVHFRAFVEDAAGELGVMGWVKNQTDGTVLVLGQGTADALKELVEHLHEGSLLSEVSGVDVTWRTADVPHDDFVAVYSHT